MRNIRIRFGAAAARSEIGGKGGDAMASPRSEVSKVLLIQRGQKGTDDQGQWEQQWQRTSKRELREQ
jgi:hypothetical protein